MACSFGLCRIGAEVANSPAQRVKTLADDQTILHDDVNDRPLAELETESESIAVRGILETTKHSLTRSYQFR
jgi:hypothetical protein